MKNPIMVPVQFLLITFLLFAEWTHAYRWIHNPCPEEQPLEKNGHQLICRKICPSGYYCYHWRCCPIILHTTTTTPTSLTTTTIPTTSTSLTTTTIPTTTPIPVICTPPPECPDGSIIIDDMGCSACVYPCPKNLCSENEFCLIKYYQTNTGENVLLGQCYENPCSTGRPYENKIGLTTLCNLNTKNSCPDSYVCTSVNLQKAACCAA
ncbi:hypothetical protein RN001_001407 [Aquatica leii]|uniref:Uncharacterized protein n=1 Tax=Aquatica leii TaxID=1421715 RepID=A0AAN7SCQ3_9COLE|nr:hypothetical protein RN001_001407 [Aquatica leii]